VLVGIRVEVGVTLGCGVSVAGGVWVGFGVWLGVITDAVGDLMTSWTGVLVAWLHPTSHKTRIIHRDNSVSARNATNFLPINQQFWDGMLCNDQLYLYLMKAKDQGLVISNW
jgi:hypothetical protein